MFVSQTFCWRSAGHPPTPRSTHGRPSVRSAAEICSKLIEIIDSARATGCPPKHRNIGHHSSLLSPFSLLPSSLPHLPPPLRFTHPSAGASWLAGWPAGHVVPRRSENCLIVRACICSWAPLDNSQEAPGQLLGSSWAARGQVLGSSCLHWAHKAFAFIRLRI